MASPRGIGINTPNRPATAAPRPADGSRRWVLAALLAACLPPGAARAQLSANDLEALQRRAGQEGWTFTVGRNSATDRPLAELCGLVVPPDWQSGARFDPSIPAPGLPAAFNWCQDGSCPQVRNQGGCGSCWAFATVGALECAILLQDGVEVDLSEQWLVSCNSDGWGCGGGWWAHKYHEYKSDPCGGSGAVLETQFPYQGAEPPCGCPYPHACTIDGWAYVGSSGSVPKVSSLKQALLDHGPLSVAVYVNSAFHAYTGGVFNDCQEGTVNHGVVLVGWDDTQGSNGVWIIRNSWGPGWGEDGYMNIEYGCSAIGYGASYIDYTATDCNTNGFPDFYDIESGTSQDCNTNGIPDECDLEDGASEDCNTNGVPDECDIDGGQSTDCDHDRIPDDCQAADCNTNGLYDPCEVAAGTAEDCNGNDLLDECDIDAGTSPDADTNGIPDECEALVLYVNAAAGGQDYGTTWTDAYHNLHQALATAAAPGTIAEQIWVASAVYTPAGPGGDREATFRLVSGVTLYGGFSGAETELAQRDPARHLTTLSGDLNADDHTGGTPAENCYHVVTSVGTSRTAVVDGFVISGGNADAQTWPHNSGGGILNQGGEVRFFGCRIAGNAADFGGGIFNKNAEPSLVNCLFSGNSADFGAAVFNDASSPTLSNCTFAGNTAKYAAAAVYGTQASTPVLTNCVLWDNTAGGSQSQAAQIFVEQALVNHSCVQGWTGSLGGVGNIGDNPLDDPLFADPDGADGIAGTADDDLRLSAGTRCIDAGDNGADIDAHLDGQQALPPVDLAGRARFVDDADTVDTGAGTPPIVDLGAHEYPGPPVPGDFDGDGDVDLADFSAWDGCLTGPNAGPYADGCQTFDFESDGDVDLRDFAGFQAALGTPRHE